LTELPVIHTRGYGINKRNFIKSLIPTKLKQLSKDVLGITAVYENMSAMQKRIDQLEERLCESNDATYERSKTRWRDAAPTTCLTWSKSIGGDAFILKAASYNAFGNEKAILEIGPGYGRLLEGILKQDMPFSNYVGIDISAKNIKYLKEKFTKPRVNFLCDDVETASLSDKFDVVLSSLVLKHLFPSFEKALNNISRYLNPGCMVLFDLIEGNKRYFEGDGVTYIRHYARQEVLEILERASLHLLTFDSVQHDPDHLRLLVVAKK
jgi:2-polyprenyl-3-methyl-5-hydroxy-6-metoxy-1,4-benzoquinol methylase